MNTTKVQRAEVYVESNARWYSRIFPETFHKAEGAWVEGVSGKRYIDFFCGAGALNYGHNSSKIKQALSDYLNDNGVVSMLDCSTSARSEFIKSIQKNLLPRIGGNYKVHIAAGTGSDCVEAALKIARMHTRRTRIMAFRNGYHGATLGALACTSEAVIRKGAGVHLRGALFAEFDDPNIPVGRAVGKIERQLRNAALHNALPAALLVESIQAEGGVKVGRDDWLREVQFLARKHGALLIIDDIQVGNGRTGTFFSFEKAGIKPDIILLGKSLSGLGLPLSILLIKRKVDILKPGQHPGTFRGFNLSFVTATATLESYWSHGSTLQNNIRLLSSKCNEFLTDICSSLPGSAYTGRGMIWGLNCEENGKSASAIQAAAFKKGLLVECCGPQKQVIKITPPITISSEDLEIGMTRLAHAARAVRAKR